MPLSYLRGILERCLAESNRCSRFCRPVPNRSAKAPFLFWDCKYRNNYLNSKFYFERLPHLKVKWGTKYQIKCLLYIKEQSFQVLPFRMVDIDRVVARLIQTIEDAYFTSALSGSREYGQCKSFLVNYLGTAVCKYESSWGDF